MDGWTGKWWQQCGFHSPQLPDSRTEGSLSLIFMSQVKPITTILILQTIFFFFLACIFKSYLTNLRSKKQQPLCVDFVLVLFQVANEAAVGQVLHHQTHSEAPCSQRDNAYVMHFCFAKRSLTSSSPPPLAIIIPLFDFFFFPECSVNTQRQRWRVISYSVSILQNLHEIFWKLKISKISYSKAVHIMPLLCHDAPKTNMAGN